MPQSGSEESVAWAGAVEAALFEQLQLSEATDGAGTLQHRVGTAQYAVVIRLRGRGCAAANSLLQQMRNHQCLRVQLSRGGQVVHVTVPVQDHGASRPLSAVRILMTHVDPVAAYEGYTACILRCAGYTVSDTPGPRTVRILSEQCGAPRLGGVADTSIVVAYVLPPTDDPLLLSLPTAYRDHCENVTQVLVKGDREVSGAVPTGEGSRQLGAVPAAAAAATVEGAPPPFVASAAAAARQAFHSPGASSLGVGAAVASLPPLSSGGAVAGGAAAALPLPPLPSSLEEEDGVMAEAEELDADHPMVEAPDAEPPRPHSRDSSRGRGGGDRIRSRSHSPLGRQRVMPQPVSAFPAAPPVVAAPSPSLATVQAFRASFVKTVTVPSRVLPDVPDVPVSDAVVMEEDSRSEGEVEGEGEDVAPMVAEDTFLPPPPSSSPSLPSPPPPACYPSALTGQESSDGQVQQRRAAVAQRGGAFPVSNGRNTHPEETGSDPYSAPAHALPSSPVAADFGSGSGYSLGGAAAQQALQFALGPAAMDAVAVGGAPIVPEHHALVLADSGASVIVPINQQAIAIPPAAKRSSRDRGGIGSNPATWALTEAIMLFIAQEPSFTPGLQKPDALSARECALAIIKGQHAYWQQRRDSTSLDVEGVRRVSNYMCSLLGITGPQAAVASAKVAAKGGKQHHSALSPASLGPTVSHMKLHPANPSSRHASSSGRSRMSAPSDCSPLGEGGGAAP